VRAVVTYGGFAMEHPDCGGALREAGLQLHMSPRDHDRSADEMIELIDGAVAVIADADPFDERVLTSAPQLRIIARCGVGLDAIDLEAAARAGVAVTITPEVNNEAVADHALALILAAVRRLREQDAIVRGGGWRSFETVSWQLHGATVGIVGYGAIGRAVARRLAAFGVELLVHDPFVTDVEVTALDELLARSDVVTLHMPLTPETRGIIGARAFARMKPGTVIVNTARGPVIDQDALIDALRSGHLGAAGLDVFEVEPPTGSPLLELPNVILSPHVGGISDASNLAMSRMATASVLDVLQNRSQ
jgi:D-3-phosphoglycerate dehydrogenase / 2-oxoglutarate reductase